MREVLEGLLLIALTLGGLFLIFWKLKKDKRERKRLRQLHRGYPIELRAFHRRDDPWVRPVFVGQDAPLPAPSCVFCGGDMVLNRAQISTLHPSCCEFKQALQSSPGGTPAKAGFLGADEAVLRRNILKIDPSAEVTLTPVQCAPMVITYIAEVRRRSLIKSAKKE
jgi:hypothetical protein